MATFAALGLPDVEWRAALFRLAELQGNVPDSFGVPDDLSELDEGS
jgi:hypothetical protein